MPRKQPYISGIPGYAGNMCSRFKDHFISTVRTVDLDRAVKEYLSAREELWSTARAVEYIVEETIRGIRRELCNRIVAESSSLSIDKLVQYAITVGLSECEELASKLEERLKLEVSNLSTGVLHKALADYEIATKPRLLEVLVNEFALRIRKSSCGELPSLALPFNVLTIFNNIRGMLDKVFAALASRVECSDVQIEVMNRALMYERPRRNVLARTLAEMARSASEKADSLDCNTLLLIARWLAETVLRNGSDLRYAPESDNLKSFLALYASKLSEAKEKCEASAVENAVSMLREQSKFL